MRHGGVAQLGEHLPCKQGVDSSILFISTTGCAGGISRRQSSATRVEEIKGKRERNEEAKDGAENTGRPRHGKVTDGHGNGLIAQVVRAHA